MTDSTTIALPTEPHLVGPFLRTLRVRLGFTQRQLMDAGVGSHATISDLENAHKMPMLGTVLAYLAVLGCAIEIRRQDGSMIPAADHRTRVMHHPHGRGGRRGPLTPPTVASEPESPCDGASRTSTGRCLACFEIHDDRTD